MPHTQARCQALQPGRDLPVHRHQAHDLPSPGPCRPVMTPTELLLKWWDDDYGSFIHDEHTYREIDKMESRRQDLLAIGIDPYAART